MKQPTKAMEALNSALWMRREAERLKKAGDLMGSPLEQSTIKRWRQDSPQAVAALEKQGLLETAAFVLVDKMLEAEKENLKAGMPLTDAREQANLDWLDLEDAQAEA